MDSLDKQLLREIVKNLVIVGERLQRLVDLAESQQDQLSRIYKELYELNEREGNRRP